MTILKHNEKITERISSVDVYFCTCGDLKGYINGLIYDSVTDRDYEILYRVHDAKNGNDYTLVSVDYGWKLKDDNEIIKIEEFLTNISKKAKLISLVQ